MSLEKSRALILDKCQDDLLFWIWLNELKGIGLHKKHQLLHKWKSPAVYYEVLKTQNKEDERLNLDRAKRILDDCIADEITIRTIAGNELPDIFRIENDLPVLLYTKGSGVPIRRGIGIIGARRCVVEGKQTAIRLAKEAVQNGEYVISGMAKGIDAYAHTSALKTGGMTIAVLGNGPEICYPKEHKLLKEAIEQQGLVVSEYPPGATPRKYTFPQRNRIIAALSKRLYVVNAGVKSGTRTTVAAAAKYGIDHETIDFPG